MKQMGNICSLRRLGGLNTMRLIAWRRTNSPSIALLTDPLSQAIRGISEIFLFFTLFATCRRKGGLRCNGFAGQ
jgi:hypothetical protein